MSRPWIIGLTGNIATGKSTVTRLAAERGAVIIDADRVAHDVLQSEDVWREVIVAFGPEVSLPDGRVDRAALGRIVFGDPDKLRQLEGLTHPAVRAEIARQIAAAGDAILLVEAIKLLEGPLAAACDQIWVTTCPRETQLERLRVCRGMDEATAIGRVDAQAPQAEKIARADVVIDTGGTMDETVAQFAAAWAALPRTTDHRPLTTDH